MFDYKQLGSNRFKVRMGLSDISIEATKGESGVIIAQLRYGGEHWTEISYKTLAFVVGKLVLKTARKCRYKYYTEYCGLQVSVYRYTKIQNPWDKLGYGAYFPGTNIRASVNGERSHTKALGKLFIKLFKERN